MELTGINGAGTALIASVLVAGSASTIISQDADDIGQDAQRILEDVIGEITTFFEIQDVFGKYYNAVEGRRIEKIVIIANQYIDSPVNLSDLTIELCNDEDIILLHYSGQSFDIGSEGLFEHSAWNTLNVTEFSVIVSNDKDRSVLDYGAIDGDVINIIIRLPEDFKMENKESMTVSISPSTGIKTSISLETPSFHSKNVISFKKF